MKEFEQYIDYESVKLYLCKIRAKRAKQLGRKHLVHALSCSKETNYHLNRNNELELNKELKMLHDMMPSRRKWKKLNKRNRYPDSNQRINSFEYNLKSLLITFDYYEKNEPNENFLVNLRQFVKELKTAINDSDFKFDPPEINPRLKDKTKPEDKTCRPIAQYKLRDRIIIGLTNRYLTDLFDKYFEECSYAFRALQIKDGDKKHLSHHDAVKEILEYRRLNYGNHLYVSECDISKFYDAVSHTIVKKLFKRLAQKARADYGKDYDLRAERIFYSYLDSYSFPQNVLKCNDPKNSSYWSEHHIPDGNYGWVEKELIDNHYFDKPRKARIGVPQGGAISGFIANIVLDYVDKEILKLNDDKLFYGRFCDDMVLIHPDKEKCKEASKIYYDSLMKLKLIPHKFKEGLANTKDSFWNEKSKSTYKWSYSEKDAFPWFGFVGYEIHYSGSLRVRKKSLKKEKDKQKEVVQQIINALNEGKRKSDESIFESAANRLIGMSVGRVNLSNYKTIKSDMCWVRGFHLLDKNRHTIAQVKGLDSHRNAQISRLKKHLKKVQQKKVKSNRYKVKKHLFMRIPGIDENQAEEIQKELIEGGVLSNSFRLKRGFDISDEDSDMGLSKKYRKWQDDIRDLLKRLTDKRKEPVDYYGKPFSYYYHVIEKNKKTLGC